MRTILALILFTWLKCLPAAAADLPDRIVCTGASTPYTLILILKDPKLPDGMGVIGMKRGENVILKIPAHVYREEPSILGWMEIGAALPKVVKLDHDTKKATLTNFGRPDLPSGTTFPCSY